MKRLTMLMALLALTACDATKSNDFSRERDEAAYRSAMEDYRAGRLEHAISALTKICSEDPAHDSARFQLACLLQDASKDYLGAYCAYREFLAHRPSSERAKLATDRMKDCERELAKALASKYGLNATADAQRDIAANREELKRSETERLNLKKELDKALGRIASLEAEASRLKDLMRAEADQDESTETTDREIAEAKQMLSEAETDGEVASPDDEVGKAKKLLSELDADSESSPLIADVLRKPSKKGAVAPEKKQLDAQQIKERELTDKYRKMRDEMQHEYVVGQGDTLYKIAQRLYGRTDMWRKIRDANKAIISNDGRVKAGQRLVLPEE